MKFENKVCVITGGANGIGRCITEEFLKEGAYIAVIDKNTLRAEMLFEKYGDKIYFMSGDISEKDTLEKFANSVINKFGKIDFLINNACLSRGGIISGCDFDDFNYVLRVGVTAPYMLTKLFLEHFDPGASIVNISSTRAYMSQADTESYTAAKGGISALTHGLSVSLAGKVRVNSISPGWIDTGAYQNVDNYDYDSAVTAEDKIQHPAGRIGNPHDIAAVAMFLCSDDAGFITGENITVDGGMTKLMIYHNDFGWKLSK